MHQVIKNRRIEDRGRVELLACDGRTDDGEDARANNRANAECGERPGAERFFKTVLGRL
jgi:hypothetical protein